MLNDLIYTKIVFSIFSKYLTTVSIKNFKISDLLDNLFFSIFHPI